MKQYYFITLLFVLGLISCEKDESGFDPARLNQISQSAEIDEVWIDINYAHWQFSLSTYSYDGNLKEYVIVSWKETGKQTAWQEMSVDIQEMVYSENQEEDLVLRNLSANTSYSMKWEASDAKGNRVAIKTMDFTTKAFTINYPKLYPSWEMSSYKGLQALHSTMSLEDGTHTLYGNGFKNVPLTIHFVSLDNSSDHFDIQPSILNDSVLTFKIPSGILPNDPYVLKKKYSVKVNQTSVLCYRAYWLELIQNQNYEKAYQEPGHFTVFNKDFIIQRVQIIKAKYQYQLDTYGFLGRLGPRNPLSVEYALGVPVDPLGYKKVIIRSGGTIIKSLDDKEKESVVHSGDNEAEAYETFLEIQSCGGYVFKLKLDTGDYTAQFVCQATDGRQVVSNEFAFKVE